MTAFEWKTFFVWRVTYICVHVTQAQFLPTSSKHVSPGMRFLGLDIGCLSHQSCMSLHIGTNNIVGGSNMIPLKVEYKMHISIYSEHILSKTISNAKCIRTTAATLNYCHKCLFSWHCKWKTHSSAQQQYTTIFTEVPIPQHCRLNMLQKKDKFMESPVTTSLQRRTKSIRKYNPTVTIQMNPIITCSTHTPSH